MTHTKQETQAWSKMFMFMKDVSETVFDKITAVYPDNVFDMVNTVYHGKPLIFTGAIRSSL